MPSGVVRNVNMHAFLFPDICCLFENERSLFANERSEHNDWLPVEAEASPSKLATKKYKKKLRHPFTGCGTHSLKF